MLPSCTLDFLRVSNGQNIVRGCAQDPLGGLQCLQTPSCEWTSLRAVTDELRYSVTKAPQTFLRLSLHNPLTALSSCMGMKFWVKI